MLLTTSSSYGPEVQPPCARSDAPLHQQIKLSSWTGADMKCRQPVLDPEVVAAKRHDRVEFIDLDISVERSQVAQVATQTDLKLKFRQFRKPGNAYASLPFTVTSFHARHTSRGWILVELRLLRLLPHNSTMDSWRYGGRKENFSSTVY